MTNFIKGIAIGISNILPGISGGSIAVLLNIYEGILDAINNFFTASLARKKTYIIFIGQLLLGAFIGILIFSKIIEGLLTNFPVQTKLFFIGLIVASLPHILTPKKLLQNKKQNLSFFLLGNLLTIGLFIISLNVSKPISIGVPPLDVTYGTKLFLSGFIAGGSMIVPGISGSLMLILLGEYSHFLYLLSNITKNIPYLIILGIGIGSGILCLAKVIGYLLKQYSKQTLAFIMGLITFSPLLIFPRNFKTINNLIIGGLFFIIGVFVVKFIDHFAIKEGE